MNSILPSGGIKPDAVRFDFRFDPRLAVHEEKLILRRELAHQFAVDHAGLQDLNGVTLYPVARAGKSGSEVFYLDLTIHGYEFPERCIAKFQNIEQTEKEAKSARSAKIAGFCNGITYYKHAKEDIGIVVYTAAPSDHIEFRGFFLDLNNSDEDCAAALKAIYLTVGRKPNGEALVKKLIEDYSWYVDRKSKPLQKIDALIDAAPPQSGIRDIASSIQETYQRIVNNLNIDIHPYLVHGDLHARNLMLSKANPAQTELIDFGWVHSGHPAKDFVLMECTLKYMLLSEVLPVAKGSSNDNLYIPAKCIEAFEQFLCKFGFDLPPVKDMVQSVFENLNAPAHQIKALSRVYVCIIEVRSAAGEVLRDYCNRYGTNILTAEQHFLAGFFLVTVGLLGFSELDQLWAMIGLQTVGAKL